ncbi:hypothetical protein T233_01017 [Vagococcus lutrae LBD1]|uniref:Uncharacterized protein n=1 Tax=Vagococcus lutrae LBD1 TaxID=1408226 RepID=V6Q3V7_9ENTE|nr:DUF5388 domain-containing protein [Vagococcus lutrae]EST89911.1 hypothetical protein T233_01017 [Vagococcus lutrae LBD1]
MALVQSNKNKKKKLINRGPDIQPKQTFTMDQLEKPVQAKKEEAKEAVVLEPEYIPKPTTLKIDTRIRDQINALSLIGYGDTQKEALELLINNVLESMTVDERRKFDVQYGVLEDKTRKSGKK